MNPANETPRLLEKLIHREIVRVIQLAVLAILAFIAIRALAQSNRQTTLRNAADWYARGTQLLDDGEGERAVAAFRRAAMANRHEPRYVLALARALAREHQEEPARTVLLGLRESMPESIEVNLELARLAAAGGDVAEAVRYYRNALYAPWREEDAARRRDVRLELIDLLLRNGQTDAARAELTAEAADAPDEAAVRLALATRFARAGDAHHALEQFKSVLRRSPRNAAALAGAGQAAFELGEYELAQRYYRATTGGEPGLATRRDLVDLIVASDPLAPRLGAAERRRRLASALAYAQERALQCVKETGEGTPGEATSELRRKAGLIEGQLRSKRVTDMDTIETGLDLTLQLERAADGKCAPSLRDRALVIIAERYAADRR